MVSYSYPLTAPSVSPERVVIGLESRVAVGVSEFTFAEDVQVHPGRRLMLEIRWPPLQDVADIRAMEQFLLRLNGMEGTFLYGEPRRTAPAGNYDSGLDTPVCDTAGSPAPNNKGDRVLYTRGWRNSGTNLLLPGDVLQLGSGATTSLQKVMTAVDSDGSGDAAIDIWPGLRRQPSDGSAIVLTNPVGLWRQATNRQGWAHEPGDLRTGFRLTAVEAGIQ
ncbi:MAG: hypothetical protein R8L07_03390 [Alphaproteobacteria bacterium]|nr:hypothetical protein [Alphaproteobacteria bacterium]